MHRIKTQAEYHCADAAVSLVKRSPKSARSYTQHDDQTMNLIDVSVEEEYVAFPVSRHDDMLDALARIVDPDPQGEVAAWR